MQAQKTKQENYLELLNFTDQGQNLRFQKEDIHSEW